jgi:hypothetical protein
LENFVAKSSSEEIRKQLAAFFYDSLPTLKQHFAAKFRGRFPDGSVDIGDFREPDFAYDLPLDRNLMDEIEKGLVPIPKVDSRDSRFCSSINQRGQPFRDYLPWSIITVFSLQVGV